MKAGYDVDRTPSKAMSRVGLQQSVVNPIVRVAWRLRIPIPGDALLETMGHRTGRPRRTPVCEGLEGETFWLVAQRGRSADWVRNIEADPRVRVRTSGPTSAWRTGTAHILDGDDPEERRQWLSRSRPARQLCLRTSARVGTDPLTVRIDLDPLASSTRRRAQVRLRPRP
jgi:deazaflavin-dependent oxidoreductase (nitroreductase family)